MDEELFNKLFFGAQTHAEEYMEKISPLLDRDEKDLSPIERARSADGMPRIERNA